MKLKFSSMKGDYIEYLSFIIIFIKSCWLYMRDICIFHFYGIENNTDNCSLFTFKACKF